MMKTIELLAIRSTCHYMKGMAHDPRKISAARDPREIITKLCIAHDPRRIRLRLVGPVRA